MRVYNLTQQQRSYLKAHIIPLMKREDELIWEGKVYSSTEVLNILNKILENGEYDQREFELLEVLRFVKQNEDKL